jgi:uncharacterized protein (DUF302 family)
METAMSYYFSKTLSYDFDEAVQSTMKVLKKADFSIVTGIDVRNTLKQKLGVDFRSYRILGACNPIMAHEAIDRSGRWRRYPTRP